MKINLPFYKENMSLAYSTLFTNTLQDEKIIRLKPTFYSFSGTGLTPHLQSNGAEVFSFPGDTQIMDKTLGKNEILNVIQNRFAIQGEGRKKVVSEKSRSIWVWIATTSLILVFAFSIIQNKIRNHQLDELYKTFYFLPDPVAFNSTTNGASKTNMSLALRAFSNKNYNQAYDLLLLIPNGTIAFNHAQLLRCICFMQENQYQKALADLLLLKNAIRSLPDVNFYAGLCYLKLGNVHSAILLFDEIKDQQSIVGKKAGEILYFLKTMN